MFVDPNEPDKAFYPISEESVKVMKIMVIVGFVLIAVVAVVIILAIIMGKKLIRNALQKIETVKNSINQVNE